LSRCWAMKTLFYGRYLCRKGVWRGRKDGGSLR